MSQQRFYDFGDPVNSVDDNSIRRFLEVPGVYGGFDLGVDTFGDVTIAAGYGLMPDGVVWQEDAVRTLDFFVPGVATVYTVVATHDDRVITGGVAVEYALQTGELTFVTDGVILGWIYHPGGVPLASTHIVQVPKATSSTYGTLLVNTMPTRMSAPLPNTFSDVATMGGNVTFTGQMADDVLFDTTFFVLHQRVAKAAGPAGFETLVQHIQFWMDHYRPASIDLYVNIPGGATITAQLRDTDLNIVTITGSPITTTTDWETVTITVDRNSGTFDLGKPYELRLTHSVDVGQQIDLARVTVNYWPFPT